MIYLVKTYTEEGGLVLDFTMGSGTTGLACYLEKRYFIGIEKDKGIYVTAKERILTYPSVLQTIKFLPSEVHEQSVNPA